MARVDPARIGGPNVAAFLDTIALCEIGKELLEQTDDGYNVIVGSLPGKPILMPSYAAHPGVKIYLPKLRIYSTAAGRYQLLKRYAGHYQKALKLSDFSPVAQDLIAARQIKEQGAILDIQEGRLFEAVAKCRNIWASFPGAGHGQHEQTREFIKAAYLLNGGTIA